MWKRKTQEEFEFEVRQKIGSDYKVLGTYINKNTKIEMIHYVCGNTFLKRPHDIIQKSSGCPYCNGNKKAKYTEQWVIENTPEPYYYVKNFINMTTKCTFHCKKCDSDFEQKPHRLINEKIYGCNCCPTKKKTNESFLAELGVDCLAEYEILEKYINADTPITFKHKNCGTVFKLSPEAFLHKFNKKYCPICYYKKSKGEILIASFLQKNNISFLKEYTFKQLPNRKFDFYLPELNFCIEYDGEQHFKSIEFFGGENAFKKTILRDKEKNQFCLNNNISLIRISYCDYQRIEEILYKIFIEKSSTTIEQYLITK